MRLIKKQFITLIALLSLQFLFGFHGIVLAEDEMDRQNSAFQEGTGYVLGGAAGIGLSLTLAAKSKDMIQGLGYSALAGFSAFGLLQGIELWTMGSRKDQAQLNLLALERALQAAGLSEIERRPVLRKFRRERRALWKDPLDDNHFWVGSVSLGASFAGILLLATGPAKSPGALVGIGVFSLASGIFGLSKFLPNDDFFLDPIRFGQGQKEGLWVDVVWQQNTPTLKTTLIF